MHLLYSKSRIHKNDSKIVITLYTFEEGCGAEKNLLASHTNGGADLGWL